MHVQVLKVDLPDYDWDRARARGDIPPEKVKLFMLLKIGMMIDDIITIGLINKQEKHKLE